MIKWASILLCKGMYFDIVMYVFIDVCIYGSVEMRNYCVQMYSGI